MKLKKRLLSWILCISMLTGLLPAAAVRAEGEINPLSATATEVKAGDELEVSFKQPKAMEGLTDIQTVLEFDKDAFEVTEISTVKLEKAEYTTTPVSKANETGKAGTVIAAAEEESAAENVTWALSEGESIVTLKLKVSDEATVGEKSFSVNTYILSNKEGECTPNIDKSGLTVAVTAKSEEPDKTGVTVEDIAEQTYTGEALEPEVVVKKADSVLTKDTDYTVRYSNNTNVGTAKVTVEKAAEGTVDFTAIEKEFLIADTYGLIPVKEKIDAIGEVTLDSAEAIAEARAAYNALQDEAKKYVTNYQVLVDAEEALEKLQTGEDLLVCWVRAEGDNGTVLPWTKVTMDKNKVPSYSDYKIISGPSDTDFISVLHVLLQGLTDRGYEDQLATVNVASSGWIMDIFGWGADNLWCLNGIDAPTMSCNYPAASGDMYTFYEAHGNWGAGYGYPGYGFFGEFGDGKDYTPKSAIETIEQTVEVGEAAQFTYLYTSSMHSPNQYGPCNNEDGCTTLVYVSKDGAEYTTDEDYREDIEVDAEGKFEVSFDEPGTYIVSARYFNPDGSTGACKAYCKVTVKDTYGVADVCAKLGKLKTVTLDSEAAIKDARAAYDALEPEKQQHVANYELLTDAEAVFPVEKQIAAIKTVTLESEEAVKAARTAYDNLTAQQKRKVVNASELTDAEAVLFVEKVIDAIGTVTQDSKKDIEKARTAYEKLTAAQKKNVVNIAVLDAAEVRVTELLIANIGEVTLNSKANIEYVREVYEQLTDAQKKEVKNYSVLLDAEVTLTIKMIDAVNDGTAATKADIEATRATYNKLTDEQKKRVTNYMELTNAEVKLAETQIANLGTITLESEDAIHTARTTYDNLTEDQKNQVSNYDILLRAEASLTECKIAAIGTVTLDSGAAIKAARADYDALPEEQQKDMVSNYSVLTDAEAVYDVEIVIKAIGTSKIFTSTKAKITKARTAYDALTEAQQAQVVNYSALVEAETIYDVVSQINTLSDGVLPESEGAVQKVRMAYDALTKAQQERVSNFNALKNAEAALPVSKLIAAIGEITPDSEEAVNEAYTAYMKLAYAEKRVVKNKDDVLDAHEILPVVQAIDSIGDVTLESEQTINEARKSYNRLSTARKKKVSNYNVLTRAEDVLKSLKNDRLEIQMDATVSYTGSKIVPKFTVKDGDKTLVIGSNYDYTVSDQVNAGQTATVTITFKGSYGGVRKAEVKIIAKDISDEAAIAAKIADQSYTGSQVKPVPTLEYNNMTLKSGKDFTIVGYQNNVKPGTATVTVKGKGNYTGTRTIEFTIGAKNLSDENVTITVPDVKFDSNKAEGYEYAPAVKVVYNKKALKNGTDYEVTYENNTAVGTAVVTIQGKGNYTGTVKKQFHIYNTDAKNFVVEKIPTIVYNGKAAEPELTVYSSKEKTEETKLVLGKDYTVQYQNNVKAGTAKAVISGIGVYGGTKTVSFTISKRSLKNEVQMTILNAENQVYSGSALKPEVKVILGDVELKYGADYTVKYTNNINAAAADAKQAPTVTITGKGSYSGSISQKFAIQPKQAELSVTVADVKYNKKAQKPAVVVMDGTRTLKKGRDYTIEYRNNTEIAEKNAVNEENESIAPTVVITGKGNYAGSTATANFRIYETAISAFVTDKIPAQVYTGSPVTLDEVLKVYASSSAKKAGAEPLVLGKDYTLDYKNNENAGTAKVVITGMGDFGGSKTVKFTIQKKNVKEDIQVTLQSSSMTYTGSSLKPVISKVTYGSVELVYGKDYTVQYANNVNVAAADAKKAPTVTITGKKNYTGSVKVSFAITEKSLTSGDISVTAPEVKYNKGKELKPTVTVKDGKKKLVKGRDYTVEYLNNQEVADINAKNAPTVVITGKGNYAGTISKTFHIYGTSISSVKAAKIANQHYTGVDICPEVVLTTGGKNSKTLLRGRDYTVAYSNNLKKGTGKITITGIGEYGGTKTVTFKITK